LGRRRHLLTIGAVAVGLVAVSGSGAQSRAFPIAVQPNVDITKLSGDDAEATIAINPVNPDEMFVAVNRFTARSSDDAGQTWKKAGGGVGKTCCDNAASWDEFGNLFLVNLNLLSSGDVNQAPLYVSTNGGMKFRKLLVLNSDPEVDQPTVKAGAGAVWATWDETGTIMASGAPVSGLGTIGPFSRPQPVIGSEGPSGHPPRRLPGRSQPAPGSEGDNGQFGDIAIGPEGQVVVAWQTAQSDFVSCPCEIDVNTDADGLGPNGFGAPVKATDTNVAKFDDIPPQPNRTVDAEGNLQYDRSGGTFDGRLYLVYTDESPDESGNTDIYIRHSDNDGATWSAAVKVNDDATTRAQFLPYVAVDQVTGNLIVTWYDARNDPTNHDAIQYWGGVSEDGGATFTNFQISAGSSDGDAGFDLDFEFGDYSWVDFFDGVAMPAWSDNSNSTGDNPDGAGFGLDLYTSRIEVGVFCNGRRATIVGTPGDDVGTIDGTSGNDVIAGLGGNDTIDGKGGNDFVCGGDGDDTFQQGAAPDGADVLIGGPGSDTTDYSARTGNVAVTLGSKANDGEKKESDDVQTENAVGGSGDDKLTGDAAANVLTGNAGKDKLFGKEGADTLNGSDGVAKNDTLDCGKDALTDVFSADAQDKIKNCP
jgi:RTX calcium-binding nonapeptide repeat (4 copies)